MSESGVTETYIYIQPVCSFCKKWTKFACPAVNFDQMIENKLMWTLTVSEVFGTVHAVVVPAANQCCNNIICVAILMELMEEKKKRVWTE